MKYTNDERTESVEENTEPEINKEWAYDKLKTFQKKEKEDSVGGASNKQQQYVNLNGRRYVVRREGRKRFIDTKQFGRLSLAEASKMDARLKKKRGLSQKNNTSSPFPMEVPMDAWSAVMDRVDASSVAAAVACTCQAARAAHRTCMWARRVRVSPRSGGVLEPVAAFDAVVDAAANLQAAIDACPHGGSVLLLPGDHAGPINVGRDKVVHVFGRGLARIAVDVQPRVAEFSLKCVATTSTFDGVAFASTVAVGGGGARFQHCEFLSECAMGVVTGGDPVVTQCRLVGVLLVADAGTQGYFERNTTDEVYIQEGATPTLAENDITPKRHENTCVSIRSHARPTLLRNRIHGGDVGIFVDSDGGGTLAHNELADHRIYGLEAHGRAIELRLLDNTFRNARKNDFFGTLAALFGMPCSNF